MGEAGDLAGGSVIEDFDLDGFLDIIATSWGLRDQVRYLRNTGRGGFVGGSLNHDGQAGGRRRTTTDLGQGLPARDDTFDCSVHRRLPYQPAA